MTGRLPLPRSLTFCRRRSTGLGCASLPASVVEAWRLRTTAPDLAKWWQSTHGGRPRAQRTLLEAVVWRPLADQILPGLRLRKYSCAEESRLW